MYKITGEYINIENMTNTPLNYIRIDNHISNNPLWNPVNSEFDECRKSCDNEPACVNFAFNPTNKMCQKFPTSDKLISNPNNCTYVKLFDMYENKGFYQHTPIFDENSINSIDTCASLCASSNDCNSYFIPSENQTHPFNMCNLKKNQDEKSLASINNGHTFIKRKNNISKLDQTKQDNLINKTTWTKQENSNYPSFIDCNLDIGNVMVNNLSHFNTLLI